MIETAAGILKKIGLQLRGKTPVAGLPDANLERAIPGVAVATFFLQGQNCLAGARTFVREAIHDAVAEGL